MLIKRKIYLLTSSIGLIVFDLNTFFEFIPFESQKVNSLILMLLSISSFIFLIRMANNKNNLK